MLALGQPRPALQPDLSATSLQPLQADGLAQADLRVHFQLHDLRRWPLQPRRLPGQRQLQVAVGAAAYPVRALLPGDGPRPLADLQADVSPSGTSSKRRKTPTACSPSSGKAALRRSLCQIISPLVGPRNMKLGTPYPSFRRPDRKEQVGCSPLNQPFSTASSGSVTAKDGLPVHGMSAVGTAWKRHGCGVKLPWIRVESACIRGGESPPIRCGKLVEWALRARARGALPSCPPTPGPRTHPITDKAVSRRTVAKGERFKIGELVLTDPATPVGMAGRRHGRLIHGKQVSLQKPKEG